MQQARAARAEAENYLLINGTEYKLSEWISPTEYAKKFKLGSIAVVNNWIARGIIPESCVISIPGMKQRLVKAIPYKER